MGNVTPFNQAAKRALGQLKRTQEETPTTIVDSRGVWCPPTPMIDLYKAWRKADLGEVIELRANEPNIEADVRAWARKSGNRVLEVKQEKDYTKVIVRITKRGKEIAEMSAAKASMDDPDETKLTPKSKLQLVTLSGFTLGLRTLEPGWRWSTFMKPIAKTDLCQIRHIGYALSGQMGFLMSDGTRLEVSAGEAFDVHEGHDAWTVGNAPFVFVDLIGAVKSARS